MQKIIISTNQAGQRFDKFLKKYMPEAGSGFLYKMLRKKNIVLNKKKADGTEILSVGDEVAFFFADETYEKFTGIKVSGDGSVQESKTDISEYQKAYGSLKNITVIYEDEDILILNKPAGILSQKATPSDLSVNEWMIGYLLHCEPALQASLRTFKPSVCNRLDRNTGGLILCGKSLAGSQYLSKVIKDRTVRKFYRTLCLGEITDTAKIAGYLKKNEKTNKVTLSSEKAEGSDYIETGYYPICSASGYTHLEVELITGKTHQIRAHLAYIGHPLVGDYKYGSKKRNDALKASYGLEAQLLHAYRVEFPEEGSEKCPQLAGKVFTAPYPEIFNRILKDIL